MKFIKEFRTNIRSYFVEVEQTYDLNGLIYLNGEISYNDTVESFSKIVPKDIFNNKELDNIVLDIIHEIEDWKVVE